MRFGCLAFTFLLTLANVTASSAATINFNLAGTAGSGLLSGNENPPNASTGTGGILAPGIQFDDATNLLTVRIAWGSTFGFNNLTGNLTGIHIHRAATFTTNAPVLVDLASSPALSSNTLIGTTTNPGAVAGSGFFTGTVDLANAGLAGTTASRVNDLLNGSLYINLHTATNPGGEIRGNLVAVPEPSSLILTALVAAGGCAWRRRNRKLAKTA
jgi:hypothetical protein